MNNIDKQTQEFIESNNKFYYKGDSPQKFIRSNVQGISTCGVPLSSVNIKKLKDSTALMSPGKQVFNATYTFDKDGIRNTTPSPGKKITDALWFGDAQMFGEGVNDNETLAYYFENLNNSYSSKNYGFLGHGPSQMLYRVTTKEFKDKYKSKNGKVFYLFRDDAIKITVGEVPWGEGYPRYEMFNGKLKYSGPFGGEDFKPDNMYLPSMFTEKDFKTTVEVFKETKNNLPDGFDLTVVIIPLTFSHYKMQKYLEKENIRVINLYYTDLEYHSKKSARFLDGVHTRYANQILAKKITDYLENNTSNYELPFKVLLKKEDVLDRLKFETLFIPCMSDFPDDDAGVIISNTLKQYIGEEQLDTSELMDYMKIIHNKKITLVGSIKNNNYINNDILTSQIGLEIFIKEFIELKTTLSKYVFTD